MNETEYTQALEQAVRTDTVGLPSLELAEKAVSAHPDSARLWLLRGTLLEACDRSEGDELAETLASYEQAAALAPETPEPQESIGWFLDTWMDDPGSAEEHMRQAISKGGGVFAYIGLARVLAQLGRNDEALATLAADACTFADHDEVEAARKEINDGFWA